MLLHLSNSSDKGLSFAWPLAGSVAQCAGGARLLLACSYTVDRSIHAEYSTYFISELSTTLKHYDWKPQHLFIFFFRGELLKLGLKLGQGLGSGICPRSVSWWDSRRTDWRMDVQGAHSCDGRMFLALTCELI